MSEEMVMTRGVAQIEAKIAEFLSAQSIAVGDYGSIGEIPLLAGDVLDSLGIVQLTMFIAEAFEVEVDDEDFVPENFATVGTLATFVHGKLQVVG